MLAMAKDILKDVCTVKNGRDACIAGIGMVIGIAAGVGGFIYGIAVIKAPDLKTLGDFLKDFGNFLTTVIMGGCIGKGAKAVMGAEPNDDYAPEPPMPS